MSNNNFMDISKLKKPNFLQRLKFKYRFWKFSRKLKNGKAFPLAVNVSNRTLADDLPNITPNDTWNEV